MSVNDRLKICLVSAEFSSLAKTGGLWVLKPGLAVLFGVAAMSLAGIPPFSGFLAKLALIEAGLEIDHLLIVLVALAVSLLTLYSMLKIWNAAFWKPCSSHRTCGMLVPARIVLSTPVGLSGST